MLAGCLDIAKGLVAAGLPILLHAGDATVILAALAAVIGHSRSPFIRFAGGRGVSPGIGGLLAIAWPAALVGVPVFVVVFAVTHISSIASLTASVVAGVGMVVMTFVWQLSPLYLAYAVGGHGAHLVLPRRQHPAPPGGPGATLRRRPGRMSLRTVAASRGRWLP